ncbi:MAG: molybdopterin-guanine dinucleotide biosynthesis protein B [Gemmatimonadota bacterium]
MIDGARYLGAVLAGGKSTRFGRDKAQAVVGGERLLDRATSVLGEVCAEVVVVSSRSEHDGAGWTRVPDLRADMGPLAGIEAALRHAEETGAAGVVVLACDLPGVGADALRRLLREIGSAAAVAPERDGTPGFEPLCAVYATGCAGPAAELLDEGVRSAHRLLDAVDGHVVRGTMSAAVNVNTPADLERAARQHEPGRGPSDTESGPPTGPTVVCVVGKKKSGKTTTVVGLVAELARRGHEVMTVKHGHGFDLDRQGTDSWKHRHSGGASRVVMAGPEGFAVMGGWGGQDAGAEQPLEELVRRYLVDADIVIAEGFKTSRFPRFEVFRSVAHAAPIYGSGEGGEPGDYLGMLSDDLSFPAECPVWNVDDPDRFSLLADVVEALHRVRWRHRAR